MLPFKFIVAVGLVSFCVQYVYVCATCVGVCVCYLSNLLYLSVQYVYVCATCVGVCECYLSSILSLL